MRGQFRVSLAQFHICCAGRVNDTIGGDFRNGLKSSVSGIDGDLPGVNSTNGDSAFVQTKHDLVAITKLYCAVNREQPRSSGYQYPFYHPIQPALSLARFCAIQFASESTLIQSVLLSDV